MSSFRINEPTVACQVLDGEAVLIHFESGCYYSSAGTGGEVFNLLATSASAASVSETLAARYGVDVDAIQSGVEQFFDQLSVEGLIVKSDVEAQAERLDKSSSSYEPPALKRFDDLQDLLLLDPIHDVDAQAGWPHPAPESNGKAD